MTSIVDRGLGDRGDLTQGEKSQEAICRDLLTLVDLFQKERDWKVEKRLYSKESLAQLDPSQRLELAKVCAEKNPSHFWRNFDLFQIQEPAQTYQLIVITLNSFSSEELTEFAPSGLGYIGAQMNRFHLTYEQRKEIALEFEKINPSAIIGDIEKFNLTEEDRFPIVIRYLEEGKGPSYFEPLHRVCQFETYQYRLQAAHAAIGFFAQNELRLEKKDFLEVVSLSLIKNPLFVASHVDVSLFSDEEQNGLFELFKRHAGGNCLYGEYLSRFPKVGYATRLACARRDVKLGQGSFKIEDYNLIEEDRFTTAQEYFANRERDFGLVGRFQLTLEHVTQLPFAIAARTGNAVLPAYWGENALSRQVAKALKDGQGIEGLILEVLSQSPWRRSADEIFDLLNKIPVIENRIETIRSLIHFMFIAQNKWKFDENHWVIKNKIIEQLCQVRSQKVRVSALGSLGVLCCLSPDIVLPATYKPSKSSAECASSVLSAHLRALGSLGLLPCLSPGVAPPATYKPSKSSAECALSLLTAHLSAASFDVTPILQRLNRRIRTDETALISLFQGLQRIYFQIGLSDEVKKRLIEILAARDSSQLLPTLGWIVSILEFEGVGAFTMEALVDPNFRSIYMRLLQHALDDIHCPEGDLLENLERTFGNYRVPNAFYTYLGRLKTLGDPEIREALKLLLESLFNGTFVDLRYSTQHLRKIDKSLVDKWKQKMEKVPIQSILGLEAVPLTEQKMGDWLRMKLVTDRHIPHKEIPYLIRYLRNDVQASAELQRALDANPEDQMLQLQMQCIELSGRLVNDSPDLLKQLKETVRLTMYNDFLNDVSGLVTVTQQKQLDLSTVTIVKTGDAENLLLCGTEVQGSCLRVDGIPDQCKGLLGYLLHGQTELIAVQDKGGKIIARALLRLLLDVEGQPVLFLERVYDNYNDPRLTAAIQKMARQVSDTLGITLTTLHERKGEHRVIQSFGGSAPFEYCDLSGGIQSKGVFTIKDAKVIYEPSRSGGSVQ